MLAADQRVGEIVVLGTMEHAVGLFSDAYEQQIDGLDLATWGRARGPKADATVVYTSIRRPSGWKAGSVCLEVVTLVRPGTSVIRGLQAIRAYLKQEAVVTPGEVGAGEELPFERTVILLGDVVYSKRCLAALVDKVSGRSQVWFAVSPDLTGATGEVFGVSYDQAGTAEFLHLLDNVKHPPFPDTYQPGQLRRLLWDRQAAVLQHAVMTPQLACCSIMDDDFTADVDTMSDLRRLSALDEMAFDDDRRGEAASYGAMDPRIGPGLR